MGFHHIAIASSDLAATHHFYGELLGFDLVKAVVAPTPKGGWAKHVFYRTGAEGDDGLIAFWELHDATMTPATVAISTGLGLEEWVNHIAFAASDLADIAGRRDAWVDAGLDVMEIDHGFCVSVYTMDPNGNLVEFCTDTAPYSEADRERARQVLTSAEPDLESPPTPVFHRGRKPAPV